MVWMVHCLLGDSHRVVGNGVHPAGLQGSVWTQSFLMSLPVIWTKGWSAPSVSFQVIPSWVGVFFSSRGQQAWRLSTTAILHSASMCHVLTPSAAHPGKPVTSAPAAFIHHCD